MRCSGRQRSGASSGPQSISVAAFSDGNRHLRTVRLGLPAGSRLARPPPVPVPKLPTGRQPNRAGEKINKRTRLPAEQLHYRSISVYYCISRLHLEPHLEGLILLPAKEQLCYMRPPPPRTTASSTWRIPPRPLASHGLHHPGPRRLDGLPSFLQSPRQILECISYCGC